MTNASKTIYTPIDFAAQNRRKENLTALAAIEVPELSFANQQMLNSKQFTTQKNEAYTFATTLFPNFKPVLKKLNLEQNKQFQVWLTDLFTNNTVTVEEAKSNILFQRFISLLLQLEAFSDQGKSDDLLNFFIKDFENSFPDE